MQLAPINFLLHTEEKLEANKFLARVIGSNPIFAAKVMIYQLLIKFIGRLAGLQNNLGHYCYISETHLISTVLYEKVTSLQVELQTIV